MYIDYIWKGVQNNYKVQYIKIDETNKIIYRKSTWKLKKPGGTC